MKCKANTIKGTRCKKNATISPYCGIHSKMNSKNNSQRLQQVAGWGSSSPTSNTSNKKEDWKKIIAKHNLIGGQNGGQRLQQVAGWGEPSDSIFQNGGQRLQQVAGWGEPSDSIFQNGGQRLQQVAGWGEPSDIL